MAERGSLKTKYSQQVNNPMISPRQAQKERISEFLETEIKDFRKMLREQSHDDSLNRLLNQMIIGESSYKKRRQAGGRQSSSTVNSPFREQLVQGMGEDNVFDLISAPVDSKTILQFYKKNNKARGQSASNTHNVKIEASSGETGDSSLKFKQAKMRIYKNRAAALLVEKLSLIFRSYFKTFLLRCPSGAPVQKKKELHAPSPKLQKIKETINQVKLLTAENEIPQDSQTLSTPPTSSNRYSSSISKSKEMGSSASMPRLNFTYNSLGKPQSPRDIKGLNGNSPPDSSSRKDTSTILNSPIRPNTNVNIKDSAQKKYQERALNTNDPDSFRRMDGKKLKLDFQVDPMDQENIINSASLRGSPNFSMKQDSKIEMVSGLKRKEGSFIENEPRKTFLKDVSKIEAKNSNTISTNINENEQTRSEFTSPTTSIKHSLLKLGDALQPDASKGVERTRSVHARNANFLSSVRSLSQDLLTPQEKPSNKSENDSIQSRMEQLAQKLKSSPSVGSSVQLKSRAESSTDLHALKGTILSLGVGEKAKLNRNRTESETTIFSDLGLKTLNDNVQSTLQISTNGLMLTPKTNRAAAEEGKTSARTRKIQLALKQKMYFLIRFSHFLNKYNGVIYAFKALKKYPEPLDYSKTFEISHDSVNVTKSVALPTFSNISPEGSPSLVGDLVQITEIDSPEASTANRLVSSQNMINYFEDNSTRNNSNKQKTASALHLARILSDKVKGIYSLYFKKFELPANRINLLEKKNSIPTPQSKEFVSTPSNQQNLDTVPSNNGQRESKRTMFLKEIGGLIEEKKNGVADKQTKLSALISEGRLTKLDEDKALRSINSLDKDIEGENKSLLQTSQVESETSIQANSGNREDKVKKTQVRRQEENQNFEASNQIRENGNIFEQNNRHLEAIKKIGNQGIVQVQVQAQGPAIDVQTLEEELEKSLEKKLEPKIEQNIGEKLRGRLEKDLKTYIGKELVTISERRYESSQDKSSQTELSIHTSNYIGTGTVLSSKKEIEDENQIDLIGKLNSKQLLSSPTHVGAEMNGAENVEITKSSIASPFNGNSPIKNNKASNNVTEAGTEVKNFETPNLSPIKNIATLNFSEPPIEEKRRIMIVSQEQTSSNRTSSDENRKNAIEKQADEKLLETATKTKTSQPEQNSSNRTSSDNNHKDAIEKQADEKLVETATKTKISQPESKTRSESCSVQAQSGRSQARVDTPKKVRTLIEKETQYSGDEATPKRSIQITYSPYRSNYKTKSQKKTLNYLLFAKKVEKLYKMRIRASFTLLCFQGALLKKQKMVCIPFVKKWEMRIMKAHFTKIRIYAKRVGNLQNALGKLFSLFQQKKLRLLYDGFHSTFSFGLIRREQSLNVTLMSVQLSEVVKSRTRSAFLLMKQRAEDVLNKKLGKKGILRKIIKAKEMKLFYKLKHVFLKWRGNANNLSITIEHEATKLANEKLMKSHLTTSLQNIFASQNRIKKFQGFYAIKHYAQNLKGALNLYATLNKKISQEFHTGNRNQKLIQLEKLSGVLKEQLQMAFEKIRGYSQSQYYSRPMKVMEIRRTIEQPKQKSALPNLNALNLSEIRRKSPSSSCVNLALKVVSLIERKQKVYKNQFFDAVLLKIEKENLQKKMYDVVLGTERLGKLFMTRKILGFRKITMYFWNRKQVEKDALSSPKDYNLTLRDINSIDSADAIQNRSSEQENNFKIKAVNVMQTMEKVFNSNLKGCFNELRLRVQKRHESFQENLGIFEKYQTRKLFNKWRNAFLIKAQKNEQISLAISKLEEICQNDELNLCKTAFKKIKKCKPTLKKAKSTEKPSVEQKSTDVKTIKKSSSNIEKILKKSMSIEKKAVTSPKSIQSASEQTSFSLLKSLGNKSYSALPGSKSPSGMAHYPSQSNLSIIKSSVSSPTNAKITSSNVAKTTNKK